MSSFRVRIPYTPKPKGSVRMAKGGTTYNPSSRGMLQMRRFVESHAAAQGLKLPLLKGPVFVIVQYQIPDALSKQEKKRKLLNCHPHSKRPDGDNLDKFIGDSLNGVVWEDDARIAFMFRSKIVTSDRIGQTVLFAKEVPPGPVSFVEIVEELERNLLDQSPW